MSSDPNSTSKNPASTKSKVKKQDNPVLGLLLAPTYWPVALFECIVAWTLTRKWLPLLLIAPLYASILFLGFSAYQGSRMKPIEIAARYLELSEKAESEKDDGRLSIFYRRLLATELEDSNRFKVAMFLARQNRVQEANEQFRILAPENKIGFGPAHLVIAKTLRTNGELQTPRGLERFKHHAKAAQVALPDDTDALLLASQVAVAEGKSELAFEYMETAAKSKPELLLLLAQLYNQFQKKEMLNATLLRTESHFTPVLTKNARDEKARTVLVQVKSLLQKLPEAIALAEDGFRLMPNSTLMRDLVVAVHLQAFDAVPPEEKATPKALYSLERVLSIAPSNVAALEKIAAFTIRDSGPESSQQWEKLKAQLKEALASGNSFPSIHMILADGYLQHQEFDLARLHLEQAFSQNPRMVAVLNNLAWIESNREPQNLNRALELVQSAIEIAPQNDEVKETYGSILLKMGNYKETIRVMEPLMQRFPDRVSIWDALAESYAKLGDATMAESFRRKADQMRNRKP